MYSDLRSRTTPTAYWKSKQLLLLVLAVLAVLDELYFVTETTMCLSGGDAYVLKWAIECNQNHTPRSCSKLE